MLQGPRTLGGTGVPPGLHVGAPGPEYEGVPSGIHGERESA